MKQLSKRLMNWASILEPKTEQQARLASEMPFIYPHLALMPDAHLGKGATVGSVIPTLGAIMPAAVGVDIGCGMIAVKTQFDHSDVLARGSLTPLREAIENAIPSSAGRYNGHIAKTAKPRIDQLEALALEAGLKPDEFVENWRLHLGSLGSGNHFIEVSLDENDDVWLFLHSGSRGIGNRIATHHIKVAQEYCADHFIKLPDRDLAYLVEGTEQFDTYIAHLRWAQRFAFLNRAEMMDRLAIEFGKFMDETVDPAEEINCHHNFTEQERHFGKQVWLSRKGAIKAEQGDWGLIPGSMGTRSYVVRGLGNWLALNSSPHGAGRVHSRSAAKRTFTLEQLEADMEGIEWKHSAAFLDEIPGAYKDIDVVMADAADLVEVVHELRQIVNVKGV